MSRYTEITESARRPHKDRSNREIMQFHRFNPNGLHDTTYTLYTEDNDHEISHPEFPSLYQVAKLHSGGFFRVLAQDTASKDDVQHVLLRTPKGDIWYPIEQVSPTL